MVVGVRLLVAALAASLAPGAHAYAPSMARSPCLRASLRAADRQPAASMFMAPVRRITARSSVNSNQPPATMLLGLSSPALSSVGGKLSGFLQAYGVAEVSLPLKAVFLLSFSAVFVIAAAALFWGATYLRRELELRAEVRDAAEACILSKDPTSAACASMEGLMRDVPDWKLRLEPAWSPLVKAPKALAAAR